MLYSPWLFTLQWLLKSKGSLSSLNLLSGTNKQLWLLSQLIYNSGSNIEIVPSTLDFWTIPELGMTFLVSCVLDKGSVTELCPQTLK